MSSTVASAWRNFRDVLRVRRSPRVSRMLCNEGAQRLAAVVDHRPAVCEQQMIEFELGRQAPVGGNQPPLYGHWIVTHVLVRDQPQRCGTIVAPEETVCARQCAQACVVERALIGAERADLVRDDTAGELVSGVVRFDGLTRRELVHAGARSAHAASKRLDEAVAVAVMMAVR